MPKNTFLPHNAREAKGMVLAIGRAAAWGALSLVDPSRLTKRSHETFWAGAAGLTAVEMMAAPEDEYLGKRGKLALAAGSAGLVWATRNWGTRTDAKITGWMRSVGIPNPRVWLAALAAGGAFAAYLTERAPSPHDDDDYLVTFADLPDDPMPRDLRALIEKMLGAVDGYEREVLEAQLASAKVVIEDPDWPLNLVADETLPTTLLREFTWPVTATFERDGRTHNIYLDIADGRLALLGQYLDDELDAGNDVDWSWPSADEVTVTPGLDESFSA